jgi:hypothetical protein
MTGLHVNKSLERERERQSFKGFFPLVRVLLILYTGLALGRGANA